MRWRRAAAVLLLAALAACDQGLTFRMDAGVPTRRDAGAGDDGALDWLGCEPGTQRCLGNWLQRCVPSGELSSVENTDCAASEQVCVEGMGCRACRPGAFRCTEGDVAVQRCRADGTGFDTIQTCDTANGLFCATDTCRSRCGAAAYTGTNMGCEYYAVDLDNAQLGVGESAASSQYAVVVSNPDETYAARVRIEVNTAPYGQPVRTRMVASAVIPPRDLEVFDLPPREVDCSAPGTFDTGTGTCLSSQAYHVISSLPVIAAQFNPLENTLQFSNDASLLVPVDSLQTDYMVMGWPQTLASRPLITALNPSNPADLRGFVTVVGTAERTTVEVTARADVLAGGPFLTRVPAGTPMRVTLGPFDVFNVETDGFEADLTGSVITADRPVAVFSGSECSDVPEWFDLNDRRCCCDHLESQAFPRSTVGRRYVALHTPARTPIVRAAGAPVALLDREVEFFRVLNVSQDTVSVRTSLPTDPDDPLSAPLVFELGPGDFRSVRAYDNFELDASGAVLVANFMSSQLNTGIPLNYPGGDPSFIPIPPIEQWRNTYVFLTPDKYAFDFVTVVAAADTPVRLDGELLPTSDCVEQRSDSCKETPQHRCDPTRWRVFQCQLSYPEIAPGLPYPRNVLPGRQRDGVHVVDAPAPVGVIVSGFDLRVSYGYPAGTQLHPLN